MTSEQRYVEKISRKDPTQAFHIQRSSLVSHLQVEDQQVPKVATESTRLLGTSTIRFTPTLQKVWQLHHRYESLVALFSILHVSKCLLYIKCFKCSLFPLAFAFTFHRCVPGSRVSRYSARSPKWCLYVLIPFCKWYK